MSWLQLSLAAGADDAEAVSAALEALGAAAVTVAPRDGAEILEPAPGEQPLARSNTVTGLFDQEVDGERLVAELARTLGAGRVAGARLERLEDAVWEQAWRQDALSRCFGEGLWVVPRDAPTPPGARAVVRLDPGLAFGTGAHPTTALCLAWLACLDLHGREVVDFGCGSGVLAIAAATLGAARVWAADHDPQALTATAENARHNAVAGRLRITDDPPSSDVLVANILANALDDLAPRFAGLVRPGGLIALSGILTGQAEGLARRYHAWFHMDPPSESEGWVLLSGRRHLPCT